MIKPSPFRCFKTSPEIILLAVMLYFWFPLSLRNVGDLLRERAIDVGHKTERFRLSSCMNHCKSIACVLEKVRPQSLSLRQSSL